jgi:hypothetical protein
MEVHWMKARMKMARANRQVRHGGFPAALLLGAAALAVPSTGFAIGAFDGDAAINEGGVFANFTPASVDPRLAELVAERSRSGSQRMRFTPAGIPNRSDTAVTVAVRINGDAAQAISVRSALAAAKEQVGAGSIELAPTRYNLGIARGYQSFAKPEAPKLTVALGNAEMPDLASYEPSQAEDRSKPSRFAARLSLEEETKAGRAPRTVEGLGEQSVDLAGSYRLTRNLDVTAGVRYSQERGALAPITNGEQDSQAVYVGTQFRF